MKKLKFLVGAVALFALVAVNVWNAATTLRGSDLDVEDVEAMAVDPEYLYEYSVVGKYSNIWWLDEVPCTGKTTEVYQDLPRNGRPTRIQTHVTTWTGKKGICRADADQFCFPYECRRSN